MKLAPLKETNSSPVICENSLVWDVVDVARELQCSVRTVRRLVANNSIPFVRVGKLVRFLPSKVREWLFKGGTR